ncbi:hypothetical protein FQN55_002848 [Onygenales sp. PD_40]|nr:hypothetical protein FQN55_002848 [Onygenales sp. PD_40]
MSLIPPVSRGIFHYSNGDLYVTSQGDNRHRRASIPELQHLFHPPPGQIQTTTTTTTTDKRTGHWYKAQLLHYGITPSNSKAVAAVRLLDALNRGSLEVPPNIRKLEEELRREWEREVRKAKKRKGKGKRLEEGWMEGIAVEGEKKKEKKEKKKQKKGEKEKSRKKRKAEEAELNDGGDHGAPAEADGMSAADIKTFNVLGKSFDFDGGVDGYTVPSSKPRRKKARADTSSKEKTRKRGPTSTTEPLASSSNTPETDIASPSQVVNVKPKSTIKTNGKKRQKTVETEPIVYSVRTVTEPPSRTQTEPPALREMSKSRTTPVPMVKAEPNDELLPPVIWTPAHRAESSTIGQQKDKLVSINATELHQSSPVEKAPPAREPTPIGRAMSSTHVSRTNTSHASNSSVPPHIHPQRASNIRRPFTENHVGLINGVYKIGFDGFHSAGTLVLSMFGKEIWGGFDFGSVKGVLHIASRPHDPSDDEADAFEFIFRGITHNQEIRSGPRCIGKMLFRGKGVRLEGIWGGYEVAEEGVES